MKTYYPCPVCGRMAPMMPLINAYAVRCGACGQTTIIYDKGTAEDQKRGVQHDKNLCKREGRE